MKAIRVTEFGPPEVLKVAELPDPVAGEGQVLVRVHAAGVNPVETYVRTGTYAIKPNLPYTPGSDGAGTVEAVGEGVTRVGVGDRVYLSGSVTGTYAELALCTAAQVHSLPENVTFAQGAAMNVPYATAYRGLFGRARVIAGETVLVHGASGGVGLAAVQLAVAHGLTVFGTAGTEAGRQLVLEQGAHEVFDHHQEGYLDQVRAQTGGVGVDVIVELAAHVNLGRDLTVLAPGGRVVVIGSRGPVEINPRDAMSRDAAILGLVLFNTPPKELAGIHQALVAGLANSTLQPVVREEIPLAEAPHAHERVMEPGSLGKIVLIP